VSRPSTFPHRSKTVQSLESVVHRKKVNFVVYGLWTIVSGLVFLAGCGSKFTYPANGVPKSIEKICRDEFQIDATARIVGKTVGALLYVRSIVDPKGQIASEVHDKMGKVMQTVTRVALSTDLQVDYCVVVIRDTSQGNELTIVRALEDTKRANADAIGIEESINRTLFQQGRTQPNLSNGKNFVLKEIKTENFIAEQIAQRIRFGFAKDPKDSANKPLNLVDGAFHEEHGKRIFRFSLIALKLDRSHQNILNVFRTVNEVFAGYQFASFDELEVNDYLNREKLVVDPQTLLDYRTKKISDNQLLEKCLQESQSVQEAFKLFGFSTPAEGNDTASQVAR